MRIKSTLFGSENFVRKSDIKPSIILLLAALIPTLHRYLGSVELYYNTFSAENTNDGLNQWWGVNFHFATAFILMGIIPLIIIKLFKEDIFDYGFSLGDWKMGIKAIIILFPVISLALLLPAAFQKEIKSFYPLYKHEGENIILLLGHEIFRGILFYIAWEFFFRGFLLFGMRKYVGDWIAILIQIIPSCLWHIGYPTGEIIVSIPAGIMFGVIAIRTRSIIWPFLLHWLIGVGLDFFILINQ